MRIAESVWTAWRPTLSAEESLAKRTQAPTQGLESSNEQTTRDDERETVGLTKHVTS